MMELALQFREEKLESFYVWREIVGLVDRVALLVSERNSFVPEEAELERFVLKLLGPAMDRFGYTPGADICTAFFGLDLRIGYYPYKNYRIHRIYLEFYTYLLS